MSRRFFYLAVFAAFALQAALLGWMIVDRALLLSRGTEVRLAVVPVDPRDLFRGDFVVLSYEISRLVTDEIAGDDVFKFGDPIFVTLLETPTGWQAVAVSHDHPKIGVVLKGVVEDVDSREDCAIDAQCQELRIDYNLEKFFVPEGEGLELEKLRNDQRVGVDIVVADSGRSGLKRLLVDDEVLYEETLY